MEEIKKQVMESIIEENMAEKTIKSIKDYLE